MKRILLIIFSLAISFSLSAQDLNLFKKEVYKDKEGGELPYRILYPKSYDKNKVYPLLLFLHGMGERGSDNEAQLNHVSTLLLNEREKGENEAIVVLPQCPETDRWVSDQLRSDLKQFKNLYTAESYETTQAMQLVEGLLDYMLALPQINKKQVSIMGLSMGGYGTLHLLANRPTTFVKAVPICGGGAISFANKYSPNTAIRLYHGGADDVVSPDLSRALYDRLQVLNADVQYKEYPGVNHSSWDNVFVEPGLMEWLTTPSNKINYTLAENISYTNNQDAYAQECCKLDFYYPANKEGFATIVWFHGGGLEGGSKFMPDGLMDKGIAIVSANYRLSPKASAPAYIEDAAEAVAWAFENIEKLGGDPKKIYVSGHSAGGYLALMVGLDKSYLAKHNINTDSIKGLMPISGQTITHNAIRKEMRLADDIPLIDKYAPLNQIRENVPPMLLVTGERSKELISRYEENLLLESSMKAKKNKVTLYEMQGFDHGSVLLPAYHLMLEWMKENHK